MTCSLSNKCTKIIVMGQFLLLLVLVKDLCSGDVLMFVCLFVCSSVTNA